ncbi:MAG: ROK family transcriptional regulator, partial [Clostridia bacterium]|nr:ROK family transcriptional regulator [Clostridia bacterium]
MAHDYQSHKRNLILNMINHLGPISRTELIALTDYRPASVGAIIKSMIEEGLVVESGYSSSGYGRKRVLLDINRNLICALSVSVNANNVSYIMAQINGVILRRFDEEIDRRLSEHALAERIVEQTRALLDEFSDRIIIGLGICNPPYDPTKYRMDGSLLSGYKQFNQWIQTILVPALEAVTTLPVRTFSAVTLPAMAEQRFGVAKGVRDFICVELSNGIGASIYVNDYPVAGANGVAGELGHCVVDYQAEKQNLCYCGKPGCVEHGTAFPALAADIVSALNRGVFSELNAFYDRKLPLKVEDIRRALDAGDQMCM